MSLHVIERRSKVNRKSVLVSTCIDQSAGKVRENNSLATWSSTWQTEDDYFNEEFYLKTLNPKRDPCSLQVNGCVAGYAVRGKLNSSVP